MVKFYVTIPNTALRRDEAEVGELLRNNVKRSPQMSGILYGVGVGPGDPKLLTLKAKEVLEGVSVIAVPVKKSGEESTALNIIKPVVNVAHKELVELEFPMEHSHTAMENSHSAAAARLRGLLDEGKDVALITLGDVSIYSTCTYVLKKIRAAGYETQIIPGIPSFCAGAALAGISLAEGHENLAVISSIRGQAAVEKFLDDFDNVVMMKAGRQMPMITGVLESRELLERATVLSNAGMPGQYIGPPDTSRDYGYFTTLVVKKGGKKE